MGRIFTPEEITRGLIPEPGAHEQAARFLLDTLHKGSLEQQGEAETNMAFNTFDGAMVYGSVAKGSASLRSDVDILLTFSIDAGQPDLVVSGYRAIFAEAEERWKVKVESNIFHTAQIISGDHTIDGQFLGHLQTVPATWRLGEPLEGIRLLDESQVDGFRRYRAHKVRSFTKSLADTSQDIDYTSLQRALELPSALGRKALSTLFHSGLEIPTPGALNKQEVLELCVELGILDAETLVSWERLTAWDRFYDRYLDNTLNSESGEVVIKLYERKLARMYRELLGDALRLATGFGNAALRKLQEI